MCSQNYNNNNNNNHNKNNLNNNPVPISSCSHWCKKTPRFAGEWNLLRYHACWRRCRSATDGHFDLHHWGVGFLGTVSQHMAAFETRIGFRMLNHKNRKRHLQEIKQNIRDCFLSMNLFLLTPSITVPLFKVFLHIRFVTRNGWVWGWGGVGDVNVPCTCLHVWCYAKLWARVWGMMLTFLELAYISYMFDATQDYGLGCGEWC